MTTTGPSHPGLGLHPLSSHFMETDGDSKTEIDRCVQEILLVKLDMVVNTCKSTQHSERLSQEGCTLQSSLGNLARPCFKI